jgi:aminopeptidase-like protein
MFKLLKKLFPLNRSLTGDGTKKTIKILQQEITGFKIKTIKSNTKVFDWKIPKEWNVDEAYVKYKNKKIIDFKKNNLHLVGYSHPFFGRLKFKDLKKNLHFLKSQPNAIPYVTSYYKLNWGFCLNYNKFKKLNKNAEYEVCIKSKLSDGQLHYGELIKKGKYNKEILLTTYICHPSMANNELSGPCVLTYLTKWLLKKKTKYTYRIVFAPETIGAIAYIKTNQKILKNIFAGLNFTCLGGKNIFTFLPSRFENSYIDELIINVLKKNKIKFKLSNWLLRGSDERQYCWPNIDIPMASIMKSKYHEYKEYHTSLDNLKFVSKKNLMKSLNIYKKIILTIENDIFPISTTLCEPNLGKRNLQNTISKKSKKNSSSKSLLNILSYSDGKNGVFNISNKVKNKKFNHYIKILKKNNLVKFSDTINL